MSYEHGTPFVNLPQTVGSDKRDWMDTNEAFRDLDAKLKTAYEGAGSSAEGLVEVNARVDEVNTTVSQHTTQIEELSAHLGTTDENVAVNSTAINGLQTEVRDNKQDLKDSICSIEEQTATAQYRHEVGTYFWYNDTLYKTTVLIAVNQQIVPNVNCDTTNITTELLNMEPETIANVVRYNTGTGKMEYNDNGTWTEIPASTITASDVGYGTSSNVGDALDGINGELTADNDTKFQFGYSGGKYGYKVGGTFHPFKEGLADYTGFGSTSVTITESYEEAYWVATSASDSVPQTINAPTGSAVVSAVQLDQQRIGVTGTANYACAVFKLVLQPGTLTKYGIGALICCK